MIIILRFILKYAWVAILIILEIASIIHVCIEFADDGVHCFVSDGVCSVWITIHTAILFLVSIDYFLSH